MSILESNYVLSTKIGVKISNLILLTVKFYELVNREAFKTLLSNKSDLKIIVNTETDRHFIAIKFCQ